MTQFQGNDLGRWDGRGPLLDVDALREVVLRSDAALCAVDGCGGSGKSTLARRLAQDARVAVIEMDDFYLPSALRANVPAVAGGNFDLARLMEQVLVPAADRCGARYQRYDWDNDILGEWVEIDGGIAIVVEGVYSSSAQLRDRYSLRVWVDTPYDVRLERGIARDGEGMRDTWVNEWMPAEVRYMESENPVSYAHLVVDGSGGDGDEPEFVVLRSSLPGMDGWTTPRDDTGRPPIPEHR